MLRCIGTAVIVAEPQLGLEASDKTFAVITL